ncbi:MAG: LacI family DNA-binding transcriptional regulator [Pseudomonadota bacterium]
MPARRSQDLKKIKDARDEKGRVKGGITLIEVAKLAGVSPMSVSRALNSPNLVSEKTLAKVLATVSETGYVANRLAGGLASQRSRLVAAVVPSIAAPVFQDLVQSLIVSLSGSNYQLMLGQTDHSHDGEDQLFNAILGRRPDGIVLVGVTPSSSGRKKLTASGIAVVETWDMVRAPIDMVVGFSHADIASEVASFLLAQNRRFLAFAGGAHERAQRRATAFSSAALDKRKKGARAESVIVQPVGVPTTVGEGRMAFREIIRRQPETDGIFCSSDLLALGMLIEAKAMGISVPEQVAIVGFGDLDFSEDVTPALTTVRIDSKKIGSCAARLIINRAEGMSNPSLVTDLGFTIIKRESA